ncbi:UDP-glucose 4-epimerase [bioreactor metagenome]|uniref:UDP-glucose 4-epimerase n=1 Tax=bioreactor metagenome TaxID=1076179 RepID=A0A645IAN8_9ZZZZ
MKKVIDIARKVTNHPIPAQVVERRAGDPAILIASSEKATKELGWNPRFNSIETILETAWNWHKNHLNGYED